MRLIARGYSYKEVAKELFISIKTVETHVSAVLRTASAPSQMVPAMASHFPGRQVDSRRRRCNEPRVRGSG